MNEHTFDTMDLLMSRLCDQDWIMPPLARPQACARCHRPGSPESRAGYPMCYKCARLQRFSAMPQVHAATYGTTGTKPYSLLLDAKYTQSRCGDNHEGKLAAVAASLITVLRDRTDVPLAGYRAGLDTLAIMPSRSELVVRALGIAASRGWAVPPRPWYVLDAEERPEQKQCRSEDERFANADGRYSSTPVAGRVVLVDDVYTTGFSMNDAVRAVTAAGASSVTGVVFCRRVDPAGLAFYREVVESGV